MWTNFENFVAIDLQNPKKEPAGSWSTRRKQLREDLEKSTCCPCLSIRNKKTFAPPQERVRGKPEILGSVIIRPPIRNRQEVGPLADHNFMKISKNPPVAHV